MNEVIQCMLERRAIRKFKPDLVSQEHLDLLMQAGIYAPSAGGRQGPIMIACQNKEINQRLGKISRSLNKAKLSTDTVYVSKDQPSIVDDPSIQNAFYDAPCVVHVFGPKNFIYTEMDCSVLAENIMVAAYSLGIGSCFIARARETFASEEGQKVFRSWGIEDHYEGVLHIALGYPSDGFPEGKKRRPDRYAYIY